jgi:hypothetical protein
VAHGGLKQTSIALKLATSRDRGVAKLTARPSALGLPIIRLLAVSTIRRSTNGVSINIPVFRLFLPSQTFK